MRNKLSKICIIEETKKKVKDVAEKYGYKDVTALEYLLNGKIPLKELNENHEM